VVKFEKTIEGHTLRLDDLTVRIAALEKAKGSCSSLDTLKGEVATFRAEVVHIRPMHILILWGDVPISDVVALAPEIPSASPSSFVPKAALDVDAKDEELDKVTDKKWLREDEQGIS